jgi:hypothetical protein
MRNCFKHVQGEENKRIIKAMKGRTLARFLLYFLVFAVVASYGAFRFVDYAGGSKISFAFPKNGRTVSNPLVTVKGSASRISYISFDGAQISTDPSGAFSRQVLLHPGYNALSVTVTDRFGREKTKTLKLVYDGTKTPATQEFAVSTSTKKNKS